MNLQIWLSCNILCYKSNERNCRSLIHLERLVGAVIKVIPFKFICSFIDLTGFAFSNFAFGTFLLTLVLLYRKFNLISGSFLTTFLVMNQLCGKSDHFFPFSIPTNFFLLYVEVTNTNLWRRLFLIANGIKN